MLAPVRELAGMRGQELELELSQPRAPATAGPDGAGHGRVGGAESPVPPIIVARRVPTARLLVGLRMIRDTSGRSDEWLELENVDR